MILCGFVDPIFCNLLTLSFRKSANTYCTFSLRINHRNLRNCDLRTSQKVSLATSGCTTSPGTEFFHCLLAGKLYVNTSGSQLLLVNKLKIPTRTEVPPLFPLPCGRILKEILHNRLDLKFCPSLLLFNYWTGGFHLNSSLCPYYMRKPTSERKLSADQQQ